MTTTTSYGTWNNHGDTLALTVEQTIYEALGDYADDYDIEAIAADYRAVINAALPSGVRLCGNEFYGPWQPEPGEFDGYPHDEDGCLDIKAIVDSVDFWAIVAKHETTKRETTN